MKNPQPLVGDCGRGEIHKFLSKCDRAVAHTGGRTEGRQSSRED